MSINMKFLLVGMPQSGKTSLLKRLTTNEFNPEYYPTRSSDFFMRSFVVTDGLTVSTHLWDIGGATPIGKTYTKNLNGIILVFDSLLLGTTGDDTDVLNSAYNNVLEIPGITEGNELLYPFIIVLNKVDLLPQGENLDLSPVIRWLLEKNVANPENISVMGSSAKTGYNVMEIFETIIKSVLTNSKMHFGRSPTTSNAGSDTGVPRPTSRRSSLNNGRIALNSLSFSMNSLSEEKMSMFNPSDVLPAKIVLVGSAGCGKTSLLSKFLDESKELSLSYEPTVGTDLRAKTIIVKDKTISLQLWDSAGDQSAFNIGRTIYKNADGAIFMYDVTSRDSFQQLDFHWDNFIKYANPDYIDDFPMLLVGTKNDLLGSAKGLRSVSMEEVLNWCSSKRPGAPVTYIESSSMHGIGVKDVFVCLADAVLENFLLQEEFAQEGNLSRQMTPDHDDMTLPPLGALSVEEYFDIGDGDGGDTVDRDTVSSYDDGSSYYDEERMDGKGRKEDKMQFDYGPRDELFASEPVAVDRNKQELLFRSNAKERHDSKTNAKDADYETASSRNVPVSKAISIDDVSKTSTDAPNAEQRFWYNSIPNLFEAFCYR